MVFANVNYHKLRGGSGLSRDCEGVSDEPPVRVGDLVARLPLPAAGGQATRSPDKIACPTRFFREAITAACTVDNTP
jgi:hypothetical protein